MSRRRDEELFFLLLNWPPAPASSIIRPIIRPFTASVEVTVMKKKFLALCTALALALSLTGCGGETPSKTPEGESLKVAIVQQRAHPSLDEIRDAVEKELTDKAEELGLSLQVKNYNGNGDSNQLDQIGAQIVSEKFDAVIPIASLAAQRMVNATEETDIPVIYAAVSDPETTGITGMDRVTGTSDALNTEFMLDMMLAQNPEIRTVGLLYCPSEDSSTKPVQEAREYLKAKNIAVEERTGTDPTEIMSAAASLAKQVDAVFTPTDNTVASVELTIAETFIEAGVPHYAGADSFVRNGAFATCGVSYTELGIKTADMAIEYLTTGKLPGFHLMDGGIITVNTETAASLGAEYDMFRDMANEVREVVTTED